MPGLSNADFHTPPCITTLDHSILAVDENEKKLKPALSSLNELMLLPGASFQPLYSLRTVDPQPLVSSDLGSLVHQLALGA